MAYRSCVTILCLLNVILEVADVLTLVGGLFIYIYFKKTSLILHCNSRTKACILKITVAKRWLRLSHGIRFNL